MYEMYEIIDENIYICFLSLCIEICSHIYVHIIDKFYYWNIITKKITLLKYIGHYSKKYLILIIFY